MTVADPQPSIWSQITGRGTAGVAQPGNRPDAHLFVIGPRGSGKSTLLNKYIQPDRTATPKSTDGLEYTFIRKPASSVSDRKELAHLWELSGSPELSQEVFGIKHVLAPEQVATAVIAVVVDLSQPAETLKSAVAWLQLVQSKLQSTYDWLEQNRSKLPEQLRLRARKYIGSSHEDREAIQHLGISLVLVAAKEDTFRDADSEARKMMARSLRYVAHLFGASLVYLGGLKGSSSNAQGSITQKEAATDKAALANFRSMMSHMLFTGMDKRMKLRTEPQMDHMKPLMIPFGSDRFADIGVPPRQGAAEVGSGATTDNWLSAAARMFPLPVQTAAKAAHNIDQELYAEAGVDAVHQDLEAQWKARHPKRVQPNEVAVKKVPLTRLQQARRRTSSSQEQR